MRWFVLALVMAGPVLAEEHEEIECWNATTQSGMTLCAKMGHEAADQELNEVWAVARSRAKEMDRIAASFGDPQDHFDLLLDGQRKWLAYRDAACLAESLVARGGSMQAMLQFDCLANLTRHRSETLRFFGELN